MPNIFRLGSQIFIQLNVCLAGFIPKFMAGAGVLLLAVATFDAAFAQERVYRCGNEYTNNPSPAQLPGCKVIASANITVVAPTPVPPPNPASASTGAGSGRNSNPTYTSRPPSSSEQVSSSEQRQRDADSRSILQSELQKTEAKLSILKKDYNNGEPEKQGIESRNNQRYLDRVAEMKNEITRLESDLQSLRRELARLGS